ncbi:hypothetical protein TWF132_002002 [Orbilia oligospora]|nr:hypothetical protein TWF132_002002 [Orbilia oligospora]
MRDVTGFKGPTLPYTLVSENIFLVLIRIREWFHPCGIWGVSDDFVIGATNTKVGQVCVGISGGILNVAYGKLNSCTYSSVHVYVGTVPPTDRNPGGFPYSSDPGGICTLFAYRTTASCPIPVQNSWRACEQTLYIATHGSVNCSPGGGQTS